MRIKKLLAFLLLLLVGLSGTSCSDRRDEASDLRQSELTPDGKLHIPVKLILPDFELVETRSVDKTGDELKLYSMGVLVFEATSSDNIADTDRLLQFNFVDKSMLSEVDFASNAYIELEPYNEDCQILLYANLSSEAQQRLNAALVSTSQNSSSATTWKELRHFLLSLGELYEKSEVPGGAYNNLAKSYPMSSAPIYLSEISVATTRQLEVPLYMSCARIDINAATINNFILKNVTLLEAPLQGVLWNTSSLPSASIQTQDYVSVPVVSDGTNLVSPIYLYSTVLLDRPTELILQGDYTDERGVKYTDGFYKVRISDNSEKEDFISILHNTLYRVNITAINSPGYCSFDEAKAQQPSNINYDIIVADNTSKDIISTNGEYYMGVSNSEHIVFTDELCEIKALTLHTNAQNKALHTSIEVIGDGMALARNQKGLDIAPDFKSATIQLPLNELPIYISIDQSANEGSVKLRIGDLVKTVTIERKQGIPNAGGVISLSEFGDLTHLMSQSDRVQITDTKNVMIHSAQQSIERNRMFSTFTAFSVERNQNILFSVPRKVKEVIYYEKYTDGSVGVFFQGSSKSTLRDNVAINEAGYGVLASSSGSAVSLEVGGTSCSNTMYVLDNVLEDTRWISLYGINEKNIVESQNFVVANIKFNGETLPQSIYPNCAKCIYFSSTVQNGTSDHPLSIRTPRQFARINRASVSKAFIQERDLDFKDTNLGGSLNYVDCIIRNSFLGVYDGGNKMMKNFMINNSSRSSLALFYKNEGTIKNLIISGGEVTGYSNVGGLTTENKGVIQHVSLNNSKVKASYLFSGIVASTNYGSILDVKVINSTVDGSGAVGGLVGENYKNIERCEVSQSYITSQRMYAGGVTGHNQENGFISNCMVSASSKLKNIVYSASEGYAGAITGCNHAGSKGIYQVLVLDLDKSCSRSFVHGASNAYIGGVVGRNSGVLSDVIFLAKAPHWEKSYPIACYYSGEGTYERCYYLKNFLITPADIIGTGLDQMAFNRISNLSTEYWTMPTAQYPYPHLRNFDLPLSWPWK